MYRRRRFGLSGLKTTALLTCLIFIWTTVTADNRLLAQPELPSNLSGAFKADDTFLNFPSEFGTVTEFYPAAKEGTPFIFHIQDAHANPDAQKNIRNILAWLDSKRNEQNAESPFLIALEGAKGAIHPEYNDFFPQYPEANEAVIRDLSAKGEITGAELFAWEKYKDGRGDRETGRTGDEREAAPVFIGVEEPGIYSSNLAIYKEFLNERETIDRALMPVSKKIEWLQNNLLSKQLREFLKERRKRKEGNYGDDELSPQLPVYLDYLRMQVKEHLKIDLNNRFEQVRFPSLVRVLVLTELAEKIDQKQVETEKQKLQKVLEQKARNADEKEMIRAFIGETPEADSRVRAENVWLWARQRQVDLSDYPEFWKSVARKILHSEIHALGLYREMDRLEGLLIDRLIENEDERQIVQSLDDLTLLKKLLALKLTRGEYETFSGRKKEILAGLFDGRLEQLSQKMPSFDSEANSQRQIKTYIQQAVKFYRLAAERDRILIENTIKTAEGKQLAVLITGGYHSEGIARLMKEEGIGYAVVQPKIEHTDGGALYEQVLEGRHADLSAYFEQPYLNQQAAVFFKELFETAVPVLWEKYQIPHVEMGSEVAGAINWHKVLREQISASAEPSEAGSRVVLQLKQPTEGKRDGETGGVEKSDERRASSDSDPDSITQSSNVALTSNYVDTAIFPSLDTAQRRPDLTTEDSPVIVIELKPAVGTTISVLQKQRTEARKDNRKHKKKEKPVRKKPAPRDTEAARRETLGSLGDVMRNAAQRARRAGRQPSAAAVPDDIRQTVSDTEKLIDHILDPDFGWDIYETQKLSLNLLVNGNNKKIFIRFMKALFDREKEVADRIMDLFEQIDVRESTALRQRAVDPFNLEESAGGAMRYSEISRDFERQRDQMTEYLQGRLPETDALRIIYETATAETSFLQWFSYTADIYHEVFDRNLTILDDRDWVRTQLAPQMTANNRLGFLASTLLGYAQEILDHPERTTAALAGTTQVGTVIPFIEDVVAQLKDFQLADQPEIYPFERVEFHFLPDPEDQPPILYNARILGEAVKEILFNALMALPVEPGTAYRRGNIAIIWSIVGRRALRVLIMNDGTLPADFDFEEKSMPHRSSRTAEERLRLRRPGRPETTVGGRGIGLFTAKVRMELLFGQLAYAGVLPQRGADPAMTVFELDFPLLGQRPELRAVDKGGMAAAVQVIGDDEAVLGLWAGRPELRKALQRKRLRDWNDWTNFLRNTQALWAVLFLPFALFGDRALDPMFLYLGASVSSAAMVIRAVIELVNRRINIISAGYVALAGMALYGMWNLFPFSPYSLALTWVITAYMGLGILEVLNLSNIGRFAYDWQDLQPMKLYFRLRRLNIPRYQALENSLHRTFIQERDAFLKAFQETRKLQQRNRSYKLAGGYKKELHTKMLKSTVSYGESLNRLTDLIRSVQDERQKSGQYLIRNAEIQALAHFVLEFLAFSEEVFTTRANRTGDIVTPDPDWNRRIDKLFSDSAEAVDIKQRFEGLFTSLDQSRTNLQQIINRRAETRKSNAEKRRPGRRQRQREEEARRLKNRRWFLWAAGAAIVTGVVVKTVPYVIKEPWQRHVVQPTIESARETVLMILDEIKDQGYPYPEILDEYAEAVKKAKNKTFGLFYKEFQFNDPPGAKPQVYIHVEQFHQIFTQLQAIGSSDLFVEALAAPIIREAWGYAGIQHWHKSELQWADEVKRVYHTERRKMPHAINPSDVRFKLYLNQNRDFMSRYMGFSITGEWFEGIHHAEALAWARKTGWYSPEAARQQIVDQKTLPQGIGQLHRRSQGLLDADERTILLQEYRGQTISHLLPWFKGQANSQTNAMGYFVLLEFERFSATQGQGGLNPRILKAMPEPLTDDYRESATHLYDLAKPYLDDLLNSLRDDMGPLKTGKAELRTGADVPVPHSAADEAASVRAALDARLAALIAEYDQAQKELDSLLQLVEDAPGVIEPSTLTVQRRIVRRLKLAIDVIQKQLAALPPAVKDPLDSLREELTKLKQELAEKEKVGGPIEYERFELGGEDEKNLQTLLTQTFGVEPQSGYFIKGSREDKLSDGRKVVTFFGTSGRALSVLYEADGRLAAVTNQGKKLIQEDAKPFQVAVLLKQKFGSVASEDSIEGSREDMLADGRKVVTYYGTGAKALSILYEKDGSLSEITGKRKKVQKEAEAYQVSALLKQAFIDDRAIWGSREDWFGDARKVVTYFGDAGTGLSILYEKDGSLSAVSGPMGRKVQPAAEPYQVTNLLELYFDGHHIRNSREDRLEDGRKVVTYFGDDGTALSVSYEADGTLSAFKKSVRRKVQKTAGDDQVADLLEQNFEKGIVYGSREERLPDGRKLVTYFGAGLTSAVSVLYEKDGSLSPITEENEVKVQEAAKSYQIKELLEQASVSEIHGGREERLSDGRKLVTYFGDDGKALSILYEEDGSLSEITGPKGKKVQKAAESYQITEILKQHFELKDVWGSREELLSDGRKVVTFFGGEGKSVSVVWIPAPALDEIEALKSRIAELEKQIAAYEELAKLKQELAKKERAGGPIEYVRFELGGEDEQHLQDLIENAFQGNVIFGSREDYLSDGRKLVTYFGDDGTALSILYEVDGRLSVVTGTGGLKVQETAGPYQVTELLRQAFQGELIIGSREDLLADGRKVVTYFGGEGTALSILYEKDGSLSEITGKRKKVQKEAEAHQVSELLKQAFKKSVIFDSRENRLADGRKVVTYFGDGGKNLSILYETDGRLSEITGPKGEKVQKAAETYQMTELLNQVFRGGMIQGSREDILPDGRKVVTYFGYGGKALSVLYEKDGRLSVVTGTGGLKVQETAGPYQVTELLRQAFQGGFTKGSREDLLADGRKVVTYFGGEGTALSILYEKDGSLAEVSKENDQKVQKAAEAHQVSELLKQAFKKSVIFDSRENRLADGRKVVTYFGDGGTALSILYEEDGSLSEITGPKGEKVQKAAETYQMTELLNQVFRGGVIQGSREDLLPDGRKVVTFFGGEGKSVSVVWIPAPALDEQAPRSTVAAVTTPEIEALRSRIAELEKRIAEYEKPAEKEKPASFQETAAKFVFEEAALPEGDAANLTQLIINDFHGEKINNSTYEFKAGPWLDLPDGRRALLVFGDQGEKIGIYLFEADGRLVSVSGTDKDMKQDLPKELLNLEQLIKNKHGYFSSPGRYVITNIKGFTWVPLPKGEKALMTYGDTNRVGFYMFDADGRLKPVTGQGNEMTQTLPAYLNALPKLVNNQHGDNGSIEGHIWIDREGGERVLMTYGIYGFDGTVGLYAFDASGKLQPVKGRGKNRAQELPEDLTRFKKDFGSMSSYTWINLKDGRRVLLTISYSNQIHAFLFESSGIYIGSDETVTQVFPESILNLIQLIKNTRGADAEVYLEGHTWLHREDGTRALITYGIRVEGIYWFDAEGNLAPVTGTDDLMDQELPEDLKNLKQLMANTRGNIGQFAGHLWLDLESGGKALILYGNDGHSKPIAQRDNQSIAGVYLFDASGKLEPVQGTDAAMTQSIPLNLAGLADIFISLQRRSSFFVELSHMAIELTPEKKLLIVSANTIGGYELRGKTVKPGEDIPLKPELRSAPLMIQADHETTLQWDHSFETLDSQAVADFINSLPQTTHGQIMSDAQGPEFVHGFQMKDEQWHRMGETEVRQFIAQNEPVIEISRWKYQLTADKTYVLGEGDEKTEIENARMRSFLELALLHGLYIVLSKYRFTAMPLFEPLTVQGAAEFLQGPIRYSSFFNREEIKIGTYGNVPYHFTESSLRRDDPSDEDDLNPARRRAYLFAAFALEHSLHETHGHPQEPVIDLAIYKEMLANANNILYEIPVSERKIPDMPLNVDENSAINWILGEFATNHAKFSKKEMLMYLTYEEVSPKEDSRMAGQLIIELGDDGDGFNMQSYDDPDLGVTRPGLPDVAEKMLQALDEYELNPQKFDPDAEINGMPNFEAVMMPQSMFAGEDTAQIREILTAMRDIDRGNPDLNVINRFFFDLPGGITRSTKFDINTDWPISGGRGFAFIGEKLKKMRDAGFLTAGARITVNQKGRVRIVFTIPILKKEETGQDDDSHVNLRDRLNESFPWIGREAMFKRGKRVDYREAYIPKSELRQQTLLEEVAESPADTETAIAAALEKVRTVNRYELDLQAQTVAQNAGNILARPGVLAERLGITLDEALALVVRFTAEDSAQTTIDGTPIIEVFRKILGEDSTWVMDRLAEGNYRLADEADIRELSNDDTLLSLAVLDLIRPKGDSTRLYVTFKDSAGYTAEDAVLNMKDMEARYHAILRKAGAADRIGQLTFVNLFGQDEDFLETDLRQTMSRRDSAGLAVISSRQNLLNHRLPVVRGVARLWQRALKLTDRLFAARLVGERLNEYEVHQLDLEVEREGLSMSSLAAKFSQMVQVLKSVVASA